MSITNKKFNQVKIGAFFSYILIIANTITTLFLMPMILNALGQSEYGVYKTVSSLSSAMLVLDFGLGGTMIRYISNYRTNEKEKQIEPFISMAFIEALIFVLLVAAVSTVLFFNITQIFGSTFNCSEMQLAKKMFIILAANIGFSIIENVLNGIISGYNNFIVSNGLKIMRLTVRILLILTLFFSKPSALLLAIIDIALTIMQIVFEYAYIRIKYHLTISLSFKNWDMFVFKESFMYTFWIFLMSVTGQFESNIDNIVIGAIDGPELVAIYSFGISIFTMYKTLSTAISSVMLPTVTETLKYDNDGKLMTNLIIKTGRIQFAILGAASVGFAVLGKQFINLWLGNGFEDVYIIVMILMIPTILELCVNVVISVLRAKNLMKFRTLVIIFSTFLNFVITVIGVKYGSYIFAAVGTTFSFVFGSVIIMNIYYYKKFSYNMIKIYLNIFSKIWICLLISGIVIFISGKFIYGTWISFFINVIIFSIVYGITMLLYGFTKQEKKSIPLINRLYK